MQDMDNEQRGIYSERSEADVLAHMVSVARERVTEGMRIGESIKTEADNLQALVEALKVDASICNSKLHSLERLTDDEVQFWRRATVRVVFAETEAIVYQLKRVALAAASSPALGFSPGEIALLREESYDLEQEGKVAVRSARLPMKANLKFAFSAFARAASSPYVLVLSGAGWNAMTKAVAIRDRLMHPKGVSSLEVTEQELNIVLEASIWFRNSVTDAMTASPMEPTFAKIDSWIRGAGS